MVFPKANAILGVALAVMALATVAQARDIIVGGKYMWTQETPDGGPMNYTDWAVKNPLYIGDTVWFQYEDYFHEVSIFNTETDFINCDYDNNIRVANQTAGSVDNGPGKPKGWGFPVPDSNARYFGCLVYGHCDAGQKVKIQATLGPAPPNPSPPPAPATPTPTPVAPPPPNAAGSLRWFHGASLVVGAVLLALLA